MKKIPDFQSNFRIFQVLVAKNSKLLPNGFTIF